MRLRQKLSYIIPILLMPSLAWSCPFCHSDRATEVRAGIAESFGNLSIVLAAASPFLVLAFVVIILHYGVQESEKL